MHPKKIFVAGDCIMLMRSLEIHCANSRRTDQVHFKNMTHRHVSIEDAADRRIA